MTMKKSNILGILVGLVIGLYTVLGMSLFTFINIKFNSVYYAQHIPHKEGTEPDIIMLMENMGWAYTPEIDGISYDDDGSYAITREKGTKTSVLDLTGDTLFFHSESETVQPVIDAQTKPLINLQWLFNLIYQSRFN